MAGSEKNQRKQQCFRHASGEGWEAELAQQSLRQEVPTAICSGTELHYIFQGTSQAKNP